MHGTVVENGLLVTEELEKAPGDPPDLIILVRSTIARDPCACALRWLRFALVALTRV